MDQEKRELISFLDWIGSYYYVKKGKWTPKYLDDDVFELNKLAKTSEELLNRYGEIMLKMKVEGECKHPYDMIVAGRCEICNKAYISIKINKDGTFVTKEEKFESI